MRSIKRASSVSIRELRDTLVRLPVEAWPYGRIVAVQECSVVDMPEDTGAGRQRLAEVEAVLKALGLQISRWPA